MNRARATQTLAGLATVTLLATTWTHLTGCGARTGLWVFPVLAPAEAAAVPFVPGDGGPCLGPVGGFPPATCDPSDEKGCTAVDAGCLIAEKCGNPRTCEPFVTNPAPGTGVDTFRLRFFHVTAPPALANKVVQTSIITSAIDLPSSLDGGAPCGENGNGTLNWLASVDQGGGTVTFGGAPPSADPFGLGYCYVNAVLLGFPVEPITLATTFSAESFATVRSANVVNLPIFIVDGGGVILFPLRDFALRDVTLSDDGNCIGAINDESLRPNPSGVCVDPSPDGPDSCSRWHPSGSLSGYILLSEADAVPVVTLGNESLCVLLTSDMTANSPPTCTAKGLTAGDYCSATHAPCANGDSVWFAGEFAASAVRIASGVGVPLCHGEVSDAG